jgi:hypothetical protein
MLTNLTLVIIGSSWARWCESDAGLSRRAPAALAASTIVGVRGVQRLVVDRYVLETLMPDLVGHDRRASAFLVYLALWARAAGRPARHARVSLRTLAEETGLSKQVYTVHRPWAQA